MSSTNMNETLGFKILWLLSMEYPFTLLDQS